MKTVKRTIALILILALCCFAAFACDEGKTANPETKKTAETKSPSTDTKDEETEPESKESLEFELSSDGKSYIVTGIGTVTDSDIVIPNTYKGLPVTAIDDDAFHPVENDLLPLGGDLSAVNDTVLTSVIISEGITSIGDNAFAWCSSLESVAIPNTVTHIGEAAFTQCESLKMITIPSNVTEISAGLFLGCDSLIRITIEGDITSIGKRAFAFCTSLNAITYPGTKTEWNNIEKGNNWDEQSDNYTVICSNGNIIK